MARKKDEDVEAEERVLSGAERAQRRLEAGDRRVARVEADEPRVDDRDEVREGQVYESLRTDEDDIGGGRRRVKVLSPDHEGKVLVENLSSRRLSHISADRLTPEHGWDRYV